MNEFFSDQIGRSLEWFGLEHILLLIGLVVSVVILWVLSPKIKNSKHEIWFRIILLSFVVLFEWKVFESRILTGSLFRIPLCGIALYGLAYSIAFRKEKIFRIVYFYAFGMFLSFLFYDTVWGLDRWNGWTYFGAHATIAWLAVYGYRVLGYKPLKGDLYRSMIFLAVYGTISGYATLKYGGSDELFLFTPPVDFLMFLKDIHEVVYLTVFSLLAALLMFSMYLPIYYSDKSNNIKGPNS